MHTQHVIDAETLSAFAADIFQGKRIPSMVASVVAQSLVLANLKGHDSHGIIRVIDYIQWLENGWLDPTGELEVLQDSVGLLRVDGHYQFGQVIARQATTLALDKTDQDGFCLLTIRRSGHFGRIGEFMEMAAERDIVSLFLTNTHGGGVLAAPHGGCQPRLSANPIGGGARLRNGQHLVMDFATCIIAEGKLKVARAKGQKVKPGCIINGKGEPTVDPEEYYGDPPGAILPIAEHKGYALALFADIFAGAIAGGSCSKSDASRIANGGFAIFVKPAAFCGRAFFDEQVGELASWIKTCKPAQGFDEVLLPGEPEAQAFAQRSVHGIPVDQTTWTKLRGIAESLSVRIPIVREDQHVTI